MRYAKFLREATAWLRGATGVDYFAMDEVLKHNPSATQLRVIIPARLDSYIQDYYTNWFHEPVTKNDIENLSIILKRIKEMNPASLLEMRYKIITQEHYNLRHDQEVTYSDEVYAFQVNESTDTQDTVDKSRNAGVPITLHKKYQI
ncbi:hypothetical protein AUJ77_02030 [Candidatus Nomurabacteria bacterium CG1_02_43_90]|uniref:Uncharacterized protein n=1 Tax=Candidatus Nomurabacteria bacterium CG1_02_43_90 TaxID=1805281 RepID=A0A1J4V3L9_9BACT|nr:MAG: hypothetical protein AUJ77_02030 [Candidatus Nomurabacteria bacterium CG1_02_43_90]